MPRGTAPLVQSAVLNYLRTAAWRGIGPVPVQWLQGYIYGQVTSATRRAVRETVLKLRRRGFPIATVYDFGYVFTPTAGPSACAAEVTPQRQRDDEPGQERDRAAHANDDRPPHLADGGLHLAQAGL